MISRKILSFLLLSVFVCSFVGFSGGVTSSGATASLFLTTEGAQLAPSVASPEPPHKILPVSMLVYTQFADVAWEWAETMATINNTYGTDYYYTNLTDYTNLDAALSGHDILLIPEQEKSNWTMMQTIGNAWGSTLTNFVDAGGIVILLDFANDTPYEYGQGLHIYNESGLMTIKGVTDYYPGGGLSTLYRVNQSDALARGIPANWPALSGTISVDTDDGTVVVDDGTNPIVVHKVMGRGHVVFLGFDLYDNDPIYGQLLANAIRLHRHVVFDDSHNQYSNILSGFTNYADDLVSQGFAVSSMDSFSPAFFSAADVLVVPACNTPYDPAEIDAIEAFVVQGGGLFLLGDWGIYGDDITTIARRFGYNSNGTDINDSDDNLGDISQIQYDGANIHNHSLTLGVSSVEFYRGSGLNETPVDAVNIVVTDADGTTTWVGGSAAIEIPLVAASTYEAGRVVVACDFNFADDNDADSDLTLDYFDDDNEILAVNTIRWLSAAGLKERLVLFDESHGAHLATNGGFLEWANYLTSNGYTVHWMSSFQTSLLDEVHVLVICDGTSNHTTSEEDAIEEFVAAGGGLFLIADIMVWGREADSIGNRFGIDRNDTSYLVDSDDNVVGNPSFIVYNESNFGSHPIMEGLSRIEVYSTTAFDTIGSGIALMSSDTDDTCEWQDGGIANGIAVFTATEYELGRVVYVTDYNFLDGNSDTDGDGDVNFYDSDNRFFTVNALQWLAENRAPAVEVTAPNGGEAISGTTSITWTAIDPNKDDFTVDIAYSTNGGGSWSVLTTGLTTMSWSWDTSTTPDSDQYLIRVEATDYELKGEDVSNAVFKVDNNGPTIANVKHDPAAPTAADTVRVSADVEDISGVKSVTCYYTINSGTEQSIAMSNVAGSLYAVDFPANFAINDVVEYYVKAKDNNDFESTSSTKSFTVAAPPGIPGFELPVVALGLLMSVAILFVVHRKRR